MARPRSPFARVHQHVEQQFGAAPILRRIDVLHAVARHQQRHGAFAEDRPPFTPRIGAAPVKLAGVVKVNVSRLAIPSSSLKS